MPSDALIAWQAERKLRLQNVEADCLHLEALHTTDVSRVQEFIRSYAVLLSAEFQGFCRDLHDECAEKFVDSIKPVALQAVLRAQCRYGRKLDTSNPKSGKPWCRFQPFSVRIMAHRVGSGHREITARRDRLRMLSEWRNAIAHHDYDPAKLGGITMLTIPQVDGWRTDCDFLATTFDAVLRKHIEDITGASPWPP